MDSSLDVWIRSSHRKPIVLFGARGVGKTTLLKELTKRQKHQFTHIDFSTNPQACAVFEHAENPREIVRSLEALTNQKIALESSLLVLDEIQLCDEALMSLRRFKDEMPELAIAAAGSSLGVHLARGGHATLPTDHVYTDTVRPLDFEEFCWALGEGEALAIAAECAEKMMPCPIHEKMLGLYREYLLVGGMPQAVERYVEERDIAAARATQETIKTVYAASMSEDAEGVDPSKIFATWRSLPAQLAKATGSTKFMWKYIARGAKAERYAAALEWLRQAGLVNLCTQVSGAMGPTNAPAHIAGGIDAFENPSSFKAYVADTGLLAQAYGANLADLLDDVSVSSVGALSERPPAVPSSPAGTRSESPAVPSSPAGTRSDRPTAPASPAGTRSDRPTAPSSLVGASFSSPAAEGGNKNTWHTPPISPYRQVLFATGLAENFVMQELVAAGERPHYWGMKSKHEAQFVLETDYGAVPIDVTPTRKRTRATAACDFARRYASPYVLQVSNRNIDRARRENTEIRIIPPYALSQVVA